MLIKIKKNKAFLLNYKNYKKNIFKNCIYLFAIVIVFCSCAEKLKKKVIDNKKENEKNYLLNIENPNQFSATLYTDELFDKKLKKINLLSFDSIDTIGRSWRLKIIVKDDFKIDTIFKIRNKNELKKILNSCFVKIPHETPKNANYVYKNNKFEPIEAQKGNQTDTSKLNKLIINAISKKSKDLLLNYENSCLKPRYFLSHPKTLAGLVELKKCVKSSIIYKIKEDEITLDSSLFGEWLCLDTSMKSNVNYKKAESFFRSLAQKYDEIIPSVTITTTNGELKTVNGGDIGVRINVYKELNLLMNDLRKAEKFNREPYYGMKGLPEGVLDTKKTYVEISLSDQKLWYYKNGSLIIESDIVTGCLKLGRKTPAGAYYVKYKETSKTLRGPGYSAFVRYWMPFNKGIGLHDAQWRKSFGGSIYIAAGSHGCINLPFNVAQTIYQNLSPGTIVLCY